MSTALLPASFRLEINAFTGDHSATSELGTDYCRWIGAGIDAPGRLLRQPPLLDHKKWLDPRVGWGLVLPTPPDLSPSELATAADAPEPIRRLLAHRGNGPVLRYSQSLPGWGIRRYELDGSYRDIALVSGARGNGPGALPRYLLVYGSPTAIPWKFQYALGVSSYVGRLDLDGEALENYVRAAETDWAGAKSQNGRAVVWAVDHGGDITSLMKRAVAIPLHKALATDGSIEATLVGDDNEDVTNVMLVEALACATPGLVVTTSHGMTGPLDDTARMAAQLGLPVDSAGKILQPSSMLASWQPDGAIWYAHACCSAGGDATTSFAGLVPKDSEVDRVFRSVAACGAMVAPLPRALLGAGRPLRAFIGHVEPTTDWSLRQPETGQLLTTPIVDAFYNHLYQPEPIGFALAECRQDAARLNDVYAKALAGLNKNGDTTHVASMLATRLMAVDREGMVILGDPAVALPPLT